MLTRIQRKAIPLFILILIIIIFIIAGADSDRLPGFLDRLLDIRYMDKVGHFLLMGILAYLANLAWKNKTIQILSMKIPIAILLIALIVGAEEYSQKFFVTRTSSWADFGASLLGILLIGWFCSQWTLKHVSE
jgi:polysaccharide biosynthesis protein VpsQ